ncbi:MAG: permease [candidate division NC10 bacterium]|nr:permease [candidate division NC10 bacterium]
MDQMVTLLSQTSFLAIGALSLKLFARLWPYALLGIVLGSFVAAFLPTERLSAACEKRGGTIAIGLATLLGVVSPLSSYAVLPIFAAMLSSGVPLPPVMAFLTASPLIDPFLFITTWGVLGPGMALARLFSAVALGFSSGLLFQYLNGRGFFSSLNGGVLETSLAGNQQVFAMISGSHAESRWRNAFRLMTKTAKYPLKYFMLAIILASVVETYIPKKLVMVSLGSSGFSIPLAALLGVPLYLCGGGAIPLVMELMQMGMDKGAALTFFLTGPATRIAPLLTVALLVKKRAFLVYLLTILFGGMLAGYLYRLF